MITVKCNECGDEVFAEAKEEKHYDVKQCSRCRDKNKYFNITE